MNTLVASTAAAHAGAACTGALGGLPAKAAVRIRCCLMGMAALALAALTACHGDSGKNEGGGGNDGRDVYVAGTTVDAQGMPTATLWTNGVPKQLSNKYSEANSVFVAGDDVYVAGRESGELIVSPVLWKNGTPHYLHSESAFTSAYSVYVSGGKEYVAGGGLDFAGEVPGFVAKVWVDGQGSSLGSGDASSVFAADGDVYVTGWSISQPVGMQATLWVNSAQQTLDAPDPLGQHMSQAHSVFVSGGSVYIAGTEIDGAGRAVLWTDGAPQRISQYESEAHSVFVSGDDVYVAGCEYKESASDKADATVWENGSPKRQVSSGSATAVSVFATPNGDVYAVGVEYDAQDMARPRLWKNGAKQNLGGDTPESVAMSVFVVERAK